MLIGIDMLGVQSPAGAHRPSGRYGRQLVEALLASDPINRYILYTHEGLSTEKIPSARNAQRVSLAPIGGQGSSRRSTIQRLLDQDPDGLDWLLMLDPFDEGYGGLPPEAPLNGPRVGSIVHDLCPVFSDDRRMIPLRRHDAVFAVTETTAIDCRKRMGLSGFRVSTIPLACESSLGSDGPMDPLTRVSGNELGQFGISGPFLLAEGPTPADLELILEGYRQLPIELRRGHQLVILGAIADPSKVRSVLQQQGSDAGLILLGHVSESSLRDLYGRCSAFVAPSDDEGSGLSLLEAMRCGAPVLTGQSPGRVEILGDAGLLVELAEPDGLSIALEDLLTDIDLATDLRLRAREWSARFSFDPVVESLVETFGRSVDTRSVRTRFDQAHRARSRIAVFPDVRLEGKERVDLSTQIPPEWVKSYAIDFYLDQDQSTRIDGLPPEFGGFDARLFGRNDAILGYHGVIYRVGRDTNLDATLIRLQRRPGLVFPLDDRALDRVGYNADEGLDEFSGWLREVFRTGSRVIVHSVRHRELILAFLPESHDQVFEVPPTSPTQSDLKLRRSRARSRINFLPGSLVIGQFGRSGLRNQGSLLSPRAFQSITRSIPDLTLLSFDSSESVGTSRIVDRYVHAGPVAPDEVEDVLAVLDLAIHSGEEGSVKILDLLKAGIPTISVTSDFPEPVVRRLSGSSRGLELARMVRALASDPEARTVLGRSALAYSVGMPDPGRSSTLLIEQVERCARELPRVPGRRPRPAERFSELAMTPHFPRPASIAGESPPSLKVEVTGR